MIRDLWGLIVAAISALFWLSRLEWRGLQNEREIRRLWAQRKEDLERASASRAETLKVLEEIQKDIKEILKRNAK